MFPDTKEDIRAIRSTDQSVLLADEFRNSSVIPLQSRVSVSRDP